MEKDYQKIVELIKKRFYEINLWKIYPVNADLFVDELTRYIEGERAEAIGWTIADDCVDLDEGRDPRYKDCAEMLERALKDLNK